MRLPLIDYYGDQINGLGGDGLLLWGAAELSTMTTAVEELRQKVPVPTSQ